MPAECGAYLLDTQPMPAWTLLAELLLAGPFVEDAIECAVAALVPRGPWAPLLYRSLADAVAIAILYMQHRRGTRRVHLQCYQLRHDREPPQPSHSSVPELAQCIPVPAAPCGWSFFLVEKSLQADEAVVQIYLFHE
jgi:hypothetical protein